VGDRLADDVGDRLPFDLGDRPQLGGELGLQPEEKVLGLGVGWHRAITISPTPVACICTVSGSELFNESHRTTAPYSDQPSRNGSAERQCRRWRHRSDCGAPPTEIGSYSLDCRLRRNAAEASAPTPS